MMTLLEIERLSETEKAELILSLRSIQALGSEIVREREDVAPPASSQSIRY